MAKKSVKHKRKSHRGAMGVIACVVLILCIVLTYNSMNLHEKLEMEKAVVESLQNQINQQNEMKEALEEKEDYMTSDEYYKELAREKLGLADSNDIVFKKENP